MCSQFYIHFSIISSEIYIHFNITCSQFYIHFSITCPHVYIHFVLVLVVSPIFVFVFTLASSVHKFIFSLVSPVHIFGTSLWYHHLFTIYIHFNVMCSQIYIHFGVITRLWLACASSPAVFVCRSHLNCLQRSYCNIEVNFHYFYVSLLRISTC